MHTDLSGYSWKEVLTVFGFAVATAAVIGLTILTLGAASASLVGLTALVGFGIGVGGSVVSQLVFTNSVDWGLAFLDGLTGAMSSCMALLPIGIIGSAAFGSVIGVGSYAASSSYLGVEMTVNGLMFAMASGFVSGLISGAGGLKDSVNKLSYLKMVSKDFVSPKKIATYAAKIASTQANIITSCTRGAVSIVSSQMFSRYYEMRFD